MFSLEVHNLYKQYGTNQVLSNISFSFGTGVLGIAGSNGSGKSTLLKCLAGLERCNSGTISWKKADDPVSDKVLKHHLGYVAPYINLYHTLTVAENLHLVLQLRKHPVPPQQVEQLWERLQLAGIEERAFGDLSTGQQQRARLACTLIYEPSILFLDEPGANLDKRGRTSIRNILADFRQADKMILLASNNPEELELADQVFSVE